MSGEHVAAHIAAKRRREEIHEEELMTHYRKAELDQGWEFKILHSATRVFRRLENLAAALETEAVAGWQLVEKFDDGRLRLKRPPAARQNDLNLPPGYDPYRTRYGISEGWLAGLIVAVVMAFVAMGIALAFFFGA